MGHIPRVHQTSRPFKSPTLEQRLASLSQARHEAAEALRRAADLQLPSRFNPYQTGDKVWLEGRNLTTTHPTAKLAPRRYGPFTITRVVSRTSYQIKLPASWKIHNVFHATLLTPYKETTLNGSWYQEPVPELIDGQPEWEVERILRVRRRCNQLQYLVRWKGFSDAHDSWEPVTNLYTDQLIQEFYKNHPMAIGNPSARTITIRRTTMSPSNSPTNPLAELPSLAYPPSPQPLMVPPRLEDRMEDPPAPLALADQLESPAPEEVPALPSPSPPVPARSQTPEGYTHYDPDDPNHVRHVRKIHLYCTPDDKPQLPHYVRFIHDMGLHQHYIYGLRDDAIPPTTPYGWKLEAAPYTGTIPHLDTTIDNAALGIFDACYARVLEVDAALYAVHDYGVLANVDMYCDRMLEYEELTAHQAQVDQELRKWHTAITPIRKRLTAAQARRRVHPYLHGLLPIPRPPSSITSFREATPHPTMTMQQAVFNNTAAGTDDALHPWDGPSHSPTTPNPAAVIAASAATPFPNALIPTLTASSPLTVPSPPVILTMDTTAPTQTPIATNSQTTPPTNTSVMKTRKAPGRLEAWMLHRLEKG